MRLDPYNRIVNAAKEGSGANLNADEVRALAMDGAIEERACEIAENRELWLEQLRLVESN